MAVDEITDQTTWSEDDSKNTIVIVIEELGQTRPFYIQYKQHRKF